MDFAGISKTVCDKPSQVEDTANAREQVALEKGTLASALSPPPGPEGCAETERLQTLLPSKRTATVSPKLFRENNDAVTDEVIAEAPRPYQIELLEAAKRGNIVAYLETGAGKTLIAAMLIRHTLETTDASKIVVFIVDRVPLVIQQSKYIRRIIKDAGRVGVYYGDLGIDAWGEKRWADELADKRVMCMTAQVFLNALRHGVVDFETVAMLVFDEAHHATKSHPFSSIMHEFYFPALKAGLSLMPRVFGMTASPIKVKGATQQAHLCEHSIEALQRNLHARVVVVSSVAQQEVDASSANPDEYILKYAPERDILPDSAEPEDLGSALDAVEFEVGKGASCYLRKCCANSRMDTAGVTPDPANLANSITDKTRKILNLLVDECKRWRALPHIGTAFRCIVFVERRAVAVALAWVINYAFSNVNDVCLRAQAVLGVHNSYSGVPAIFRMTHAHQAEVLAEFANGGFGVMVATSVVEEGLDVPSCSLVVMYNTISTPKAYIQTKGRARHLASRYVMLVPESGLGAIFAGQSIQQAKDGTEIMIHTVKRGGSLDRDEKKELWGAMALPGSAISEEPFLVSKTTRARVSASAAVNLLYAYCSSLPRDKYTIAAGAWQPDFRIESDGSRGFVCTVELPASCPVRKGHCKVPQASRIKAKRMASLDVYTSLYELGALDEHLFPRDYSSRYREADIDPGKSEALNAIEVAAFSSRDALAAKKVSKRLRRCQVKQPPTLMWGTISSTSGEECEQAFLYEIRLNLSFPEDSCMDSLVGPHRYGILTKHRVDNEDLVALQPPTGRPLFTLVLLGPISISDDRIGILLRYSQILSSILRDNGLTAPVRLQEDHKIAEKASDTNEKVAVEKGPDDAVIPLFSESLECDDESVGSTATSETDFRPGFFLIPLFDPTSLKTTIYTAASDLLDWQTMKDLIAFREAVGDDIPGDQSVVDDPRLLQFRLVMSRHDNFQRLYFTGRLKPSMTVSSSCMEVFGHDRFRTFLEYYECRHETHVSDINQPLLAGFSRQCIGQRLSLRKPFYLVPELCRTIPLSPWAAFYVALLPFWQTFLAVQCFRRKLGVHNTITFSEFAAALQPRRSSAHTAGISYERLEFIGDAALKALVSIATFRDRPFDHEGLLTSARDKSICNSFLCDRSEILRTYDVVAMTGSSVKLKSWPWFLGSPQERVLVMSEKLLADCLEALIGLHLVCGGLKFAAKFLSDVGILENVSQNPTPTSSLCRSHVYDALEDPRLESPRLKEVERILGYKFKRRELLLEALTHASYMQSKVMSYQRLEFLGDAVVGFQILNGFYRKYTDFAPAELTFLREPALSNELFGRVVVEHGLQRYLWYDSNCLKQDIDEVTRLLSTERDGVDAVANAAMPKVLGDLLESLIGAIVVDQEMDFTGLDPIIDRLLADALNRFANPKTLVRHPVTTIAHVLQSKLNETAVFLFEGVRKSDGGEDYLVPGSGEALVIERCGANQVTHRQAIRCAVLVNGVKLASAVGPNRRKAKRDAAIAALEVVDHVDDAELKQMCDWIGPTSTQ